LKVVRRTEKGGEHRRSRQTSFLEGEEALSGWVERLGVDIKKKIPGYLGSRSEEFVH